MIFLTEFNQTSQMSCVQSFAHQREMLKGRLSKSATAPKGTLDIKMQHEGRMTKCRYMTSWDDNALKFQIVTAQMRGLQRRRAVSLSQQI